MSTTTDGTRQRGARRRGSSTAATLGLVGVIVLLLAAVGGLLVWGLTGATSPADGHGPGTANLTGPAEAIEASLSAARTLVEAGEHAKAEAVLTSAVGEHPDDIELRLALAEVLLHGERSDEAYAQHEAVLAMDPNRPDVHFSAGTLASTIGRGDRAIEHYGMARSIDPAEPRYALFLAAAQLEAGERDEAKVNFLHALHLDEQSATAAAALAQIALDENERELALNYARRARAIDPAELAYVVLEARSLRRLGEAEEALAMLLALPDQQLHVPGVLSLAGECFGLLRRPADAAQLYAEASEANPSNAELPYQAALWFERAGSAEDGAAYAKRAQMLGHPQAGVVADRLGG